MTHKLLLLLPLPKHPSLLKPLKHKKTPKTEIAADVKSTPKYKSHGRLFSKAVFTNYKHGFRNQHEKQAILMVKGTRRREHGEFYVAKLGVYVYKDETKKCVPQNPQRKTRARTTWVKVTRLNSCCVRARFNTNLPDHAMDHRIRIPEFKLF